MKVLHDIFYPVKNTRDKGTVPQILLCIRLKFSQNSASSDVKPELDAKFSIQ